MTDPRWIPVRERLPEVSGNVLATLLRTRTGERFVTNIRFVVGPGFSPWANTEVIAWMPLPLPFTRID